MKTAAHKSKIPGLSFETKTIGAFKYLSIIHCKSGIPILNFNSPVNGVKKAMDKADLILSSANWDIVKEQFTNDHGNAVLELKKHIILDEHGKYAIL